MSRHALGSVMIAAIVMLAVGFGGLSGGCRDKQPTTTTRETTSTTLVAREIKVFKDVRFMSERESERPPLLDVYAPTQPGPWPVAVMLAGGFETKDSYIGDWASKVAQRGAVVFVPDWTRGSELPSDLGALRDTLVGEISDIAAAVQFARGTAAAYGGDPSNVTLFGHSRGAMGATMEAFSRAPASDGGLEATGSTIPESLVVFDGDYLLAPPYPWDELLRKAPSLMQVYTPWQYLGRRAEFPITVVGSGDPSLSRPLGDPWAEDSWFVVRDPSGEIRRGLEGVGDLKGDTYLNENLLKLLVQRLKEDGDTVKYVRLTNSTHSYVSEKDMPTLVGLIVPRTTQ